MAISTSTAPTAPEGCLSAPAAGRAGPIDSARLRLRPPRVADADAFVAMLNDKGVVDATANIPYPYTRDDALAFVERAGREMAEGRGLVFAIEERAGGGVVGCIGATITAASAELGYWLGRAHWGRGYATEAARRVVRLLFAQWGCTMVWACPLPENAASHHVLEKAGFAFDRRERRAMPARGIECDLDLYVLDRETWEMARAERPRVLVAAAALIDPDGRVLLARRPDGKAMAGLWEFPGGKVGPDETPESALIRELAEELGIEATESCLAPLAFASHDYDSFHLLMPLYAIRQWRGRAEAREGQTLAWVRPARLSDYPMPPADIPLVAILRDWL